MKPNENESKVDLVINDDVFMSMASTAAMEAPGVAGMSAQLTNIKGAISKAKGGSGGVIVNKKDGEITLDVYICVKQGYKILDVAEDVQRNVKNTVQDMTNCVISAVNVCVSDVEIPAEEKGEE